MRAFSAMGRARQASVGGRVSPDQAQETNEVTPLAVAPKMVSPRHHRHPTQQGQSKGTLSCDALRDFSHLQSPWPSRNMPDRMVVDVGMGPVG